MNSAIEYMLSFPPKNLTNFDPPKKKLHNQTEHERLETFVDFFANVVE